MRWKNQAISKDIFSYCSIVNGVKDDRVLCLELALSAFPTYIVKILQAVTLKS